MLTAACHESRQRVQNVNIHCRQWPKLSFDSFSTITTNWQRGQYSTSPIVSRVF